MSNGAADASREANSDYSQWEKNALGNFNSDIGSYMSNVNSTLGAGNPYQSKPFLQNRNIETSAAMNSANNKAQQQLRDTTLRTGTNSAALAAEIADQRRQGQRDLTTYNATADNENEDKWLAEQQHLRGEQLAGANAQSGVYGTSATGRSGAIGDLTTLQDSSNKMWEGLGTAAMAGAGTGMTAAFA